LRFWTAPSDFSAHPGDDAFREDELEWTYTGERRHMSRSARFQETLRKLAIFDERFTRDVIGLGIDPVRSCQLDARAVALLQLAVSVALGSSAVCLQWSASRALAAGATSDEIVDVLLAIAPVVGLGRVVSAAPDLATALEYDVAAALEDLDDR
jgi:4-carboxymuconolactone decarboxylase